MDEILYQQYINEEEVGWTGRKRKKQVNKEKFLKVSKLVSDEQLPLSKGRAYCEKHLKNKVSGSLGLIEYFLLRAVIGWIIDKILSYYFN